MAIAYNSVSPATKVSNAASATSGSWTIAGSDRVLIGFTATESGPPRSPTGMKWGGSGGTALTIIGSILSAGSFGRLAAYRLIAPTASSTTLYGTCSGTSDEIYVGGVSYTGVDQTSPIGTTASNTGSISASSGTASVTIATAVGDTVVAGLFLVDTNFRNPTSAPTGSPSPTERYEVSGAAADTLSIQEVVATGTSTTVSFAISAGGTMAATWAIQAMVLTPAGGGTQSYSYTAAGGIQFAGTAARAATRVAAAAGGLTLAGTAARAARRTASAAGGIQFGGAAPSSRRAIRTPAGGVVFGGTAPYDTHSSSRIVAAAGGVVFGGAAGVSYFVAGGGGGGLEVWLYYPRGIPIPSRLL